MLIALTFLGTGDYQKTTYIKHDDTNKTYKTDLFPIAVGHLYEPDQIIAFTTPKVEKNKKDDLEKLENEFGEKFSSALIPNGNSPQELWEIFNNCINVFNDDENNSEVEIVLDTTHAFRSIPLLIFIVSAYLRQVKNIKLKHIIYGAFEARNSATNMTPIFDLTPFVEILDWMNAVNVFQNYGDARPIAELSVQSNIADALNNLSNALLTNRTLEAQTAAMKFNGLPFDDSQQPPFRMLVEQLKQSYSQMAVNQPDANSDKSLKAQYRQIKWYMDNQHYLQSITLMREWLISYKCTQDENGHWLSSDKRKKAEKALGNRIQTQTSQLAAGLAPLAKDNELIDLWEKCGKIRNDIAHCGMQNQPPPQTATEAITGINELFQKFENFVNKHLLR